ncbi:MAG: ECF transporter S component [Candidatus Kariarchaeaceae archaeon]
MDQTKSNRTFFIFSTAELVFFAALAALGGISSPLISQATQPLKSILPGVPVGQFAAGLHVIWLILARCLTRSHGGGTVVGSLKGLVELLLGSWHGWPVFLISTAQGVIIDLCFFFGSKMKAMTVVIFAGGISAVASSLLFQMWFSGFATIDLWPLIILFSFTSGMLLGGYVGWLFAKIIDDAKLLSFPPSGFFAS